MRVYVGLQTAIPGSNPGGASPVQVPFLTAKERLTRVIPSTWGHPRFLLRTAAGRTLSQSKAGFGLRDAVVLSGPPDSALQSRRIRALHRYDSTLWELGQRGCDDGHV